MDSFYFEDLLKPDFSLEKTSKLNSYFENGGTWQDLLKIDLESLQIQYSRAYSFLQNKDYLKAASAFSYLTILNPYNSSYWLGLGNSKQSAQHYEEAIVAYTMVEAISPQNPIPHLFLSQCYFALNQKDKALEHLNEAYSKSENDPQYHEIRNKASALLKHFPKRSL